MSRVARIAAACALLAAGALAAVAGAPQPGPASDEVTAVELAQWIRDRRPGLVVVDVRDAEAIAQGSVSGARPLADVGAIDAGATVVIYGDRDIDAQPLATLPLAARRVLRLHGGYRAWNAEVLFPTVRSDASEAQQQAFAARAQLSRYFGGTPRQRDPGMRAAQTRSRRGC